MLTLLKNAIIVNKIYMKRGRFYFTFTFAGFC